MSSTELGAPAGASDGAVASRLIVTLSELVPSALVALHVGLLAARSFGAAKTYCTLAGAIYLVLVVVGLVAPTGFSLMPLGSNDPWLHAALGVPLLAADLTAKPAAP